MKLQGLILYFDSFLPLTLCHRIFLDEERAKLHGLRIYFQFVGCRNVPGNKRLYAIVQPRSNNCNLNCNFDPLHWKWRCLNRSEEEEEEQEELNLCHC